VKTHGKNLIFTSDFTWDVSLASDFISENSWKNSDFHKWFHLGRVTCKWFHKWKLMEKFWFSQVISLGTCHLQVI